jgi:hypothetical protein
MIDAETLRLRITVDGRVHEGTLVPGQGIVITGVPPAVVSAVADKIAAGEPVGHGVTEEESIPFLYRLFPPQR